MRSAKPPVCRARSCRARHALPVLTSNLRASMSFTVSFLATRALEPSSHDLSQVDMNSESGTISPAVRVRPTLLGHIRSRASITGSRRSSCSRASSPRSARPPHIPGGLWTRIVVGMISVCLVASSNYVINEVLDAPSDLSHPVKRNRPVPSGQVSMPLAYVAVDRARWSSASGSGCSSTDPFALTMFVLWVMGCVYNIPPVRSEGPARTSTCCRSRSTTRCACSPAGT